MSDVSDASDVNAVSDVSAKSDVSGPVLVLVGAPGAGKSTVGRRVAATMGLDFVDTDELIVQAAGMPVPDIFVSQGEPAFRALEEQAVAQALDATGSIVSLGGGAVISEITRARLRGHRVVWLRVSVSDAASRVGMNASRPLLLGNVRGRLAALMTEREQWYEQVSTSVVDTTGRPIEHVVSDVLAIAHQGTHP
ncbi:MAG: shikimate kinase [Actinomycetales bacterium]|nr:shikimate kinase [Actinomycetales bacterium]